MFDEGFKIGTLDPPQFCFTCRLIEVEEERDGGEGAVNGSLLVVRPPFIPQIVLEVLFFGEFQESKCFEDPSDGGPSMMIVL